MAHRANLLRAVASLAAATVVCTRLARAADAPAPSVTTSPAASATAGTAIAAPPNGLKLATAVQLALTRNERARISDLNVTVAEAGVEKARAGFLPVLTFNGNDSQVAMVGAGQPANVTAGALVLTQPVVNPSAYPLYAQAKALAAAQRSQNVDDKRLLGFNAASAFLAVLNSGAVVEAAQHQLDNAQSNVADTQARAEAQLTSSNDVTRARVDVAGAARELEADKGSLANAYVQLAFLLNAPVGGPLANPDETLAVAQQTIGALDDLVRFATERRPDIVVSKNAAVAAHHFANEPMMRLIPSVALTGTASGTSNSPPSTQSSKAWNQETLAGTLTWTIYDAGSRYADKHARDAQAAIADLNLQQLVRNVAAQVRSASALLAAAQLEFQVAGQSRDAARQNVEETAILYRQGLAKAIELIDANDSRFTSEVNYAEAQYSMAEAYLALRQALGLDALGTELK